MDTNKQPGITFETVLLKELIFSRKDGFSEKPELDIKLKSDPSFSPEGDMMNLEMTCEIHDENNFFSIKCTMLGVFSIIAGSENLGLKEFSRYSAPAIIFPYIRETIASTTTKAGIPPVILPPMNLTAIKGNTDKDQ